VASFSEWTTSGDVTGALDSSTKYAGNSSYGASKSFPYKVGVNSIADLTRNNFTCSKICLIAWVKTYATSSYGTGYSTAILRHPSYGDFTIQQAAATDTTVNNPWEKFRVWLWYDAASNTKFGRLEKWVTDAWVQQGTDTNFGSGASTEQSLTLRFRFQRASYASGSGSGSAWFDEVETYDVD